MDFGDLDLSSVHRNRPQVQRVLTEDPPVTPLNVRLEADRSPSFTSSISEPATVIRWQTPPQFAAPTPPHSYPAPPQYSQGSIQSPPQFAPSPPQSYPPPLQFPQPTHQTTYHTPDFTPYQTPRTSPERSLETLRRSFETLTRNNHYKRSIDGNEAAYASDAPLVVRFDEEQIRSDEAAAIRRDREMDTIEADLCPPTPNIDDTPYIRFALEQLTRDEEIRAAQGGRTSSSSGSYPVERVVPDYGLGYMTPEREREALALARKHRSSPGEGRLFNFNATRPLSSHSNPPPNDQHTSDPIPFSTDVFIPADVPQNHSRYSDLTFVPKILRPVSMMILSCLCLLMIVLLMLCALYSTSRRGLMNWYGGIYGSRYFLFSFLPQILAACIFLYIQGVMAATTRIMPYTLMAMDDAHDRRNALFIGAFQRTMLWPRYVGLISVDIVNTIFWLSIFTIPLASSLFSVKQVDADWRWVAVQGVAWTLIAIYTLIVAAAVMTGIFFFQRMTGLMWDPRSLADVVALLPRSNCLREYPGTDIMRNKEDIRHKLRDRSDRLGYWRTLDRNQGVFYCIGEEGASTRQYTLEFGRLHEKVPRIDQDYLDIEKGEDIHSTDTRFRYIPWYLRDAMVSLWAITAFLVLVALLLISFLPATSILKGFRPRVPVVANSAGFSPANFLYSFVPSVVGMLLYLLFQPLDMSLRVLQPWAELGRREGASAEESLLVDYPARFPIDCTLSALSRGHFRVAVTSLLSFLFILLPVLAGGVFFPLTAPSLEVRMIPNLPSYYITLTLLVIYLFALANIIPNRHLMHLPHGVDCLAEIISFVYGSQILDDPAFRAPRSKTDLVTRLMASRNKSRGGGVNRYAFGVYRGRNNKECLGIERLGRNTSNRVMVLAGRL